MLYEYLEENQSATRNNANIRAIAYMYDTSIWNTKYLDNKEIGEYAIGSPSIEMLLNSYNKVNNTNYGAKVISNDGYKISTNKDETGNIINKICVQELIEELGDREKEIIILRYYKGKTQSEVAQRLGITQVQVSRIEKKILLEMRQKIA